MTEQIKYDIDLIAGAKNAAKDGAPHRHVVFGYRITGADLFRIDSDPQAQISTQYEDLILREAIVEFGALPQPANGKRLQVPLSLLLDLDSVDREDLTAAHNQFQAMSQGDRQPAMMPPDKIKLMFGFTIGEQTYDLVQFGRRLTGRDEVAADKQGLTGVARMCYRAGQQISKVAMACAKCAGAGKRSEVGGQRSEVGDQKCAECKGTGRREGSEVDGPIDLEFFKTLDGADIQIVGAGAEIWRQSFRLRGGSVQGNGKSANANVDGDKNRVDGGSAAGATAATA